MKRSNHKRQRSEVLTNSSEPIFKIEFNASSKRPSRNDTPQIVNSPPGAIEEEKHDFGEESIKDNPI